jgi:hypothetical protein
MDMAEIIKNSVTNQPGLYERMGKNIFPPALKPNVRVGKRERPYDEDS